MQLWHRQRSVSYTHLDVHKRQGYCGEDEFVSATTIKKKSHRYKSFGILCLCEFIIVLGQCIGGNAMEFELLADSIKPVSYTHLQRQITYIHGIILSGIRSERKRLRM